MKGLLISATHKSSGKTVFSTGLCAELKRRAITVQPFKKGPDYIDPKWLSAASGRPCYNLDFHTQTEQEILTLLTDQAQDSEIAIVEANKGLYDGLALDGSDSNAALAKSLALPVLLVIDCEGTTRGIAPLLQGYRQFDSGLHIIGVVLNKVGGLRHENKLRQAVETYVDMPVFGALGKDHRLHLPERHLGLIPDREVTKAADHIEKMREAIAEQVDIAAILDNAGTPRTLSAASQLPRLSTTKAIRLGVFYDAAFHFYYPDDFDDLRAHGVELIFINALHDAELPKVDALWIGGGFPETQAPALEKNKSLRTAVKAVIEAGMPAYAECGGLMYLARSLRWQGKQYDMVGVIESDITMHEKPQGRGYVNLQETDVMPWPKINKQTIYPAHEFHYSRLEHVAKSANMAYKVLRGEGIGNGLDGMVYKNLLATYSHQRFTQSNPWTRRFIRFIHDKCE